uniref:Uncharacterized protein n=1 Tax=Anguilla anguilla TaxID=7936 RepID=A0A0E9R8P2_ANGAN
MSAKLNQSYSINIVQCWYICDMHILSKCLFMLLTTVPIVQARTRDTPF